MEERLKLILGTLNTIKVCGKADCYSIVAISNELEKLIAEVQEHGE